MLEPHERYVNAVSVGHRELEKTGIHSMSACRYAPVAQYSCSFHAIETNSHQIHDAFVWRTHKPPGASLEDESIAIFRPPEVLKKSPVRHGKKLALTLQTDVYFGESL